MLAKRLKSLHILVVLLLVFLTIQYEFGMSVNLSNPPSLPPIQFSLGILLSTLYQIGSVALIHTFLGTFLVLTAMVGMILSLFIKIRSVQVFSVLDLITMVLAEVNGILYVLSGLQNDNYSHGMATMFILTFGFAFLELYFLKPQQALK